MLVAIPAIGVMARVLDTERFAIVTLAWALVGYAGILELGVSRAVTRFIAASRTSPDTHSEILSSAVALVVCVGGVATVLIVIAADPLARYVIRVSPTMRSDCVSGLHIVALGLPLLMATLVLQGYWDGVEDFLEANLQRALGGALVPAATTVAAVIWPSFTGAMAGLLAARIIVLAMLLLRRGLRAQLTWQGVQPARIKGLVGFGGWLTVSNAISPLMGYLDRYILAYTRGAGLVGYYAAPAEAALRLLLLPVAVTRGLFPKLVTASPASQQRRLVRQAYLLISVTCVPLALVVALLAKPLLELWLGDQYAVRSTPVLQIMMAGFLACAFAQVPFTRLHAMGRPDLSAKVHALEVLPFLFVAFWLTSALGEFGAAIAWSLRNIVDAALLEVVARWQSR